MYLTGYHGTIDESAKCIMKEKRFKLSTGKNQWLGDGIYFYFNFEDAYNWKSTKGDALAESIMHTIVSVEDDEYLDLNTENGQEIFKAAIDWVCQNANVVPLNSHAQENQCAVAKIIWDSCEKVKVLAAALPVAKTKLPTLIDTRPRRREFCVRSNDYIKYIHQIKRGEIND